MRPNRVGICGSDLLGRHDGLAEGQGFGHEWTGTVLTAPSGQNRIRVGQTVTSSAFLGCGTCNACRDNRTNHCVKPVILGAGPLGAARTWLSIDAAQLCPLPDELGAASILVEPASVSVEVLHALGRTGGRGDRIAVLGAGSIGLMTAIVLAECGVAPVVIEIQPERRGIANALGFDTVTPEAAVDLHARQFDVVVDCTSCYCGGDGGWESAVSLVRRGGRIVGVAKYRGDRRVPLQPLASGGLTVTWLRGASVPALEEAATQWAPILEEHHGRLVSHVMPIRQINEALDLATGLDQSLKVVLDLTA